MPRETNDCHGDEHILEALCKRPKSDPDADMSDADIDRWVEAELRAQRRALIKDAATPEQLRGKV